jgi:2-polyprenyl-3-methyl-5-hydroxy-6-metoxy-1,4-benzoquinol methylase
VRPALTPFAAVDESVGTYHERPRLDIVDVARRHGMSGRVLDVGCAAGILGSLLLRDGMASSVVGVEADADVADAAKGRLSHVVVGDASAPGIVDDLPGPFDALVFADVLEHLVDPLGTLRRFLSLLVPGGLCLISVPNVRYFRVVGDLVLRNEWKYRTQGVLDGTHLRFFTFVSAQRLCADAGLQTLGSYAPLTLRGRRLATAVPPLVSFLTPQLILACRAHPARPESLARS